MMIHELFENVIDASDIFKKRQEARDKQKKQSLPKSAVDSQIQKIIDNKIKDAKIWLNDEMKKYQFAVSSFQGYSKTDDSVTSALFIPLYDVTDPNYNRALSLVTTHKHDLLRIITGYVEQLKNVMADARSKAEELTGDWRNANELLTESSINKLFTAASKLFQRVYALKEKKMG